MDRVGLVFASSVLLAASAFTASAQQAPASAPSTEVTIYKVPERSYLTQGPIATNPQTIDTFEANAAYQSSIPGEGIAGFSNYPLPGAFELPGAYRY